MFVIAIVASVLLCPFAVRAQDEVRPGWFGSVQFLQTWNSIDDVPEDVYTGMCWGPIPEPGVAATEASRWHSLGGPFIMSVSVTTDWNDEYEPSDPSDRMVDLDGVPADHPLPPYGKRYSIVSPKWQEFLGRKVRLAIEQGADGVHFGNAQTPPRTFEQWHEQQATFDPVTMEVFRDYLERKYTTAQLESKFGITDIATFNLVEWINSDGRRDEWNAPPWRGLTREYRVFLLTETKNFFARISVFAHTYARDVYGRDFTVSAAVDFGATGYLLEDEADYYIGEHASFDDASPFASLDIKSFSAIRDWPVVVLPEPRVTGLPESVSGMMKLLLADIYASGGTVAFGKRLTDTLSPPYPALDVDSAVLRNYSSFIRNNAALFEDLEPVTELGLINPMVSKEGANWILDEETPRVDAGPSYYGVGSLLIDLNHQFFPLLAPDSRFSEQTLTLEELKRHEVVIAPHTPILSDNQFDVLEQYVREGGTLIATGYLGTHTEDGEAIERPLPAGAHEGAGVFPLGEGRLVRTAGFEGFGYMEGDEEERALIRDEVNLLLGSYLRPLVKVSNVTAEYRYGGGTVFLYESPHQDWIAHVVNYDFDEFADQFSVKTGLELEIRVGDRLFDEAVYVSPDEEAPQVLPMERNGETVKLTIPRLEAYGVVVLQQNQSAPMVDGADGVLQKNVVAGSSVSISAPVSDADGNAVFLRWYVDGVLVREARGTEFSFDFPAGSEGTHVVTLVVSDGSHEVTVEWTVIVEPYTFPKVVFDESNGERNSIDLVKAADLSPEHPEWVSFDTLRQELAKEFEIARFTGEGISAEVLDQNDILVLAAPAEALSKEEIEMIVAAVTAGKGLVVLGDAGLPEDINGLLETFRISFDGHPILGSGETNVAGPKVTRFVSHPAVGENPAFRTNGGGSLSGIGLPAIGLGFTGGETWRDLDSNSVRNGNEPGGPFPVLAAAEFGKGRVWCVSDNAFHDAALEDDLSNADLFAAGLRWVAEANMTRLPPSFDADAIVNAASYSGGAVAPGEIVTIFGTSLAHPNAASLKLSTDGRFILDELEGVQVYFDETPAPLLFTSAMQVSAVAPLSISGKETTQVRVRYLDRSSVPVTIPVVPAAPGIFTLGSSGQGNGAILNQDFTVNGSSNPASPGSVVSVFGTAGGQLEPAAEDGEIATEAKWLQAQVTATIGGEAAEVTYAGAAPGLVNGVIQFNIRVPEGAAQDLAAPIVVSVNGQQSQDSVTLSIQ